MKMLNIASNEIEITPEADAYNSFRLKYQKIAEHAKKDFDDEFSIFDDIDQLCYELPNITQKYLIGTVDTAIRDLIKLGITDISDELFISQYVIPHLSWKDDISELDDKYMKIILDSAQYEDYRQSTFDNSGRIMGGGFGVEGVVAGMAIATAANLAIGAVSGVFNTANNNLNSIAAKKLKADLFIDSQTRANLADSIYRLVFQVHLAVVDVIREKIDHILYEDVSELNRSKANAIFENIKKDRIPEKDIQKSLLDIIRLNPYIEDLYSFWIDKYGDSDKELWTIAKYYGIRVVNDSKEEIKTNDSNFISFDNDVTFTENDNLDESEVNKEILTIDEDRTFDGKVFNTPEEAHNIKVKYVEKFLNSGKKIEDGKAKEFVNILVNDDNLNIFQGVYGLIMMISILLMIFGTPWWHGLVFMIVIGTCLLPYETSLKRKALKKWLHENKTE